MSQLLSSASPFSTISGGNGNTKKKPRMLDSFKNAVSQKDPYTMPSNDLQKQLEDQQKRTEKVEAIINNMSKLKISGDTQDDLGSFYDGSKEYLQKSKYEQVVPPLPNTLNEHPQSTTERNKVEAFISPAAIQSTQGSSYSNSYGPTPYYKQMTSKQSPSMEINPNSQLMEKLNYMIHLLEEQQKEPTQHILEEFVLYSLLCVFMIYLVDSFTRSGKYVR